MIDLHNSIKIIIKQIKIFSLSVATIFINYSSFGNWIDYLSHRLRDFSSCQVHIFMKNVQIIFIDAISSEVLQKRWHKVKMKSHIAKQHTGFLLHHDTLKLCSLMLFMANWWPWSLYLILYTLYLYNLFFIFQSSIHLVWYPLLVV